MANFIDELKGLDPKQPGNWPWPFKAAAFIILFVVLQVVAYFVFWQGQMEAMARESVKRRMCPSSLEAWASA